MTKILDKLVEESRKARNDFYRTEGGSFKEIAAFVIWRAKVMGLYDQPFFNEHRNAISIKHDYTRHLDYMKRQHKWSPP